MSSRQLARTLVVLVGAALLVAPVAGAQDLPGPPRTAPNPGPSDSMSRAVARTLLKADRDEAAFAKSVLPNLHDPEVRRFAQWMMDQHSAALVKVTAIGQRLRIPTEPADSFVTSGYAAVTDSQYIDGQVIAHQQLLGRLPLYDSAITDKELRDHVGEVRKTVQAHLDEAKRILGRLQGK
jgi:putative membrane protein